MKKWIKRLIEELKLVNEFYRTTDLSLDACRDWLQERGCGDMQNSKHLYNIFIDVKWEEFKTKKSLTNEKE